jgi:hypothetical protein
VKHVELLLWLRSECGVGHGRTNAIISYLQDPELAEKILEDTETEKAKKQIVSISLDSRNLLQAERC